MPLGIERLCEIDKRNNGLGPTAMAPLAMLFCWPHAVTANRMKIEILSAPEDTHVSRLMANLLLNCDRSDPHNYDRQHTKAA